MNARDIIALVAETFGLPPSVLTGVNRSRRCHRPRIVAMALIRDYLGYSTPQIGRLFGDRDHSTVLAALDRIVELIDQDQALAAKMAQLRGALDLIQFPAPTDPKQARKTAETISRAFRASVMSAAQSDPDAFLAASTGLLARCERR